MQVANSSWKRIFRDSPGSTLSARTLAPHMSSSAGETYTASMGLVALLMMSKSRSSARAAIGSASVAAMATTSSIRRITVAGSFPSFDESMQPHDDYDGSSTIHWKSLAPG